jgi:hypothetical protein
MKYSICILFLVSSCSFVSIACAKSELSGEVGMGYFMNSSKSTFPYMSLNYDDWTLGLDEIYKTYDYYKFIYLSIGLEADVNSITLVERENALFILNNRLYISRYIYIHTKIQQDFLDGYYGARYSSGIDLTIPILKDATLALYINPLLIHENNNYTRAHYENVEIKDIGLTHQELNIGLSAKLTRQVHLILLHTLQRPDNHLKNISSRNIERNRVIFKFKF